MNIKIQYLKHVKSVSVRVSYVCDNVYIWIHKNKIYSLSFAGVFFIHSFSPLTTPLIAKYTSKILINLDVISKTYVDNRRART